MLSHQLSQNHSGCQRSADALRTPWSQGSREDATGWCVQLGGRGRPATTLEILCKRFPETNRRLISCQAVLERLGPRAAPASPPSHGSGEQGGL